MSQENKMELPFPRYVRSGRCVRCGECCLNEDCDHFEFDGKIATCKIHDSPSRPLICSLFPDMPPILFKDCGYYFIDLWDDNKKISPGDGLR